IQMDQFDAGWESVENATRYEYELYKEQERVDGNTTPELTVHFDNLQSGCNYKYRVRALADSPEDYIESEWSDFANLSTLVDYVDAVWQKENWVDVYTTSGIRLTRCRVKDVWGTSLRHGVYIIRYANGATKRVLVD
ncbi:MAG: fibronectin type III domain-containing protein, partial [Bacteroidaceae bacterium]|nr:fibronectin type III domain-containing protein [Bacteroidaceae bacterium]